MQMFNPKLDLNDAANRSLQVVSLSRSNSFSGTVDDAHDKHKALASQARIIAATHFLPLSVSVSKETPAEPYKWEVARRSGHTAMYAGIRSLNDHANLDCTILGWIGNYKDLKGEERSCSGLTEESRANIRLAVPVFFDEETANGHYEDPSWWKSYRKVNETFASAISEIFNEGDITAMLRNINPTATIGLFFHSPFPSSELFRSLPQRKEILNGMLGSTRIGFQTYSYARHFLSSCTRVLGLESTPTGIDNHGSMVTIGVFPIGIDVKLVQERRAQPSVKDKINNLSEMFAGKRIIIGRDKVDEVAGIKQKLDAFEKFLEIYPEWQNQVVLIQVTQPGQTRQPRLENKISSCSYGSLEFMPVLYHQSFLDTDEYMALLNIADLCLITAIRDGMNTGSLEYVVFYGTAGSVSGAIQINPWDYEGVAQAINTALCMSSDEKKVRFNQMYKHVVSHDAQYWASTVIEDLRATVLVGQSNSVTPSLDADYFAKSFASSKKRLIMLDYDGTLTPITNNPEEALPPPAMLKALRKLCADPRNFVCIISGRDREFLDLHLSDIKGISLSSEHGSFIRYPDGDWINILDEVDMSWKDEVLAIFQFYTERTAGSMYGEFQSKECMNHLENSVVSKRPVEILVGKKCLEVRPMSVNKGEIVKRLMGAHPEQWDFVACAGDDKTDEDMFRAVRSMKRSINDGGAEDVDGKPPHYFTITKTAAAWHLTSPQRVITALERLAETE
ncbi:glycosyltransferase family 20-domain-containing protein [Kickxella alabastrina]|uniref:glycosyltransferase family 20-domain-containing protein n=1 Tax=Kickxella alabastrina TaxID=61397 RepID=UPI0022200C7D|nr:glycosyltransferase family 20-domain-containing protein [Kickxella alabastrina]KAI7826369.1 glycosyltransferase family 20-domain-containing protein [Kickxella alabastrina]